MAAFTAIPAIILFSLIFGLVSIAAILIGFVQRGGCSYKFIANSLLILTIYVVILLILFGLGLGLGLTLQ